MTDLINSLAPFVAALAPLLALLLGLWALGLVIQDKAKAEGHAEGMGQGYEAGFRAGYEYARPGLKWGGKPPSNPFDPSP